MGGLATCQSGYASTGSWPQLTGSTQGTKLPTFIKLCRSFMWPSHMPAINLASYCNVHNFVL